ncbi:UvrD-helicase domain-containing protein [Actinotalea ferrariae]|nr:ATP-dependent helicase [Actinotalea ferrariae]
MAAATMGQANTVVSAGPGAGKTELLAQRADFVLRTGLCPYPRRILAVSFKTDAARNLRDRVRRRSGPEYAARFDSFTFHAFAKRLIDAFRPVLSGYNALDPDYRIDPTSPGARIEREQIRFADLVPLALEILESSAYARGAIRQTYSHVFLDEFQDCTADQYKLIKLAFGRTTSALTAVGDTKQRIMAWAGALDGVMQAFAEDFAAKPLPLYQNFRSAPRLRRMQNAMIAHMDPLAVSPDEDLAGDGGAIEVLAFDDEATEAEALAGLIEGWLEEGVEAHEIAVLVRQQPHLVAAPLGRELTNRGVPYRNEQESQDLAAEPAAALVFNLLRVIALDRQPGAYVELMRVAARPSASEEDASRFDRELKRKIVAIRASVRGDQFASQDLAAWRAPVLELLALITRPVLTALSPAYQQGTRLDDVVEQALLAFERELAVDDDPRKALRRLSEEDAVRLLTIHKCKGLEFEKVIVLGVEEELFWGEGQAPTSEFFVAVSRAKEHLVLTHANRRRRPATAVRRWDVRRTPHREFLAFCDTR